MSLSARSVRRATWLLIAGFALLRFLYLGVLPLSGDEAYHWNWSRHLALCYHDHGGVTGASIWLSRLLLGGDSEYSARIAALVYLVLSALVGAGLARRTLLEAAGTALQAERAGLLAAALLLLTPIFAALAGYISTDPASIFFTLWTLDCLHRAVTGGRPGWWLLGGVVLAGAVQSKFLTLGLGPAILITLYLVRGEPGAPGWRRLLLGVAGFGIGMLPMLIWNLRHDWGTFRFNFAGRHDDMGFELRHPLEFVGGQLGVVSPGIAICGVILVGHLLRGRLARSTIGVRVLLPAAALPLLLLLIGSFTRTVGVHWAVTAWAPLLVLLAVEAARPDGIFAAGRMRALWRWSMRIGIGITAALFVLALAPHLLLKVDLGGFGRARKISTKAVAEVFGWPELGAEVTRARDEMLAAQEPRRGVFVMTNQFGTSSLVTFYSGQQVEALLWSHVKDHGESLRLWQDLPSHRGEDALFVTKHEPDHDLPVLRAHFEEVGAPEPLTITIEGRAIRTFWLVRCRGYDGVEPYPLAGH